MRRGIAMSMPGFQAERSLGPSRGVYRGGALAGGTIAAAGDASALRPALDRDQYCTTTHAGYVTFPIRVCRLPYPLPDLGLGPPAAVAPGASPQQSSVCRVLRGPWLAAVVQEQSCDTRKPDHFTLSIVGAPRPVHLEWDGTLQDAPATVGALGNLSPLVPTCSCCPGKMPCPDGSFVPLTSSCDPPFPA
jgi:hypothetical protein